MWHWTFKKEIEKQEPTIPEEKWEREDCINLRISLIWWQIKSIEKAKIIANCLWIIEEEMWVWSSSLVMWNVFICPDTDFWELNTTAMEIFLQKQINRMQ
jgi:hypothetical protein